MKTDFVIGRLTALELKGFSHYFLHSTKETIHLYGNDKLPRWLNELSANIVFIRHTRTSIFSGVEKNTSLHYTSSVFWKKGMKGLVISSPKRGVSQNVCKLNRATINLDSENRVIAKEGVLDEKYFITVPKDFNPQYNEKRYDDTHPVQLNFYSD